MNAKIKVAICGLAHGPYDRSIEDAAYTIGRELVSAGCVVLTGATEGYPYFAAKAASEAGGLSIGISPADSFSEHQGRYKKPVDAFDPIIYTGFGYQGRNVVLIRSCDAAIFIGGGSGTLNEFTTAFRLGKVMGVLKGSGLISDSLDTITTICGVSSSSPAIIHESDPIQLVKMVCDKEKQELV